MIGNAALPTVSACDALLSSPSLDDGDGGTDTATFDVIVEDTTPPTITQPTDLTVEATSASGATLSGTTLPTVTDLVDGSVPVTCAPPVGATLPFGRTTVTCSATDTRGNASADASFAVTVVDTTGPAITVPDDLTVEATSSAGAVATFPTPTATDVVDGDVAASCDASSGDTFPLGPTTVTCSARDVAGNETESRFVVTVADTTGPALTVPANITAEATSAAGANVPFTVSATDLVDGSRPVVCQVGGNVVTSPAFVPVGPTTVTCSTTDSRNNTATGSFTVTVRDTTGPSITWVGGPQPNRSYTRGTLPGEPTCTATDAANTVTQCRVYGYSTAPGTHTLTARARDAEGNSSVATRTYTVVAGGGGTSPTATPTPRPTTAPTQTPRPTATPTRAPRPTGRRSRPSRPPPRRSPLSSQRRRRPGRHAGDGRPGRTALA